MFSKRILHARVEVGYIPVYVYRTYVFTRETYKLWFNLVRRTLFLSGEKGGEEKERLMVFGVAVMCVTTGTTTAAMATLAAPANAAAIGTHHLPPFATGRFFSRAEKSLF